MAPRPPIERPAADSGARRGRFASPLLLAVLPLVLAAGFGMGWLVSGRARPAPAMARTSQPAVPLTAATSTPLAVPVATQVIPAPTPPPAGPSTTVVTLDVGSVSRQYLELTPGQPLSANIPILVVLHGVAASAEVEAGRDGLLPLVTEGKADLVYPVGIGQSWNAGGCCGPAAQEKVDDVEFLRTLVPELDPSHAHRIYLAGYSNGGRMVYTMACDAPGLVDGFAVVNAVPVQPCASARAVTILQIAGTADPEVAYQPGDKGDETVPVTTQVGQLRALDACPAAATTTRQGRLVMATWVGCVDGTRLGFASYQGGNHGWPIGDPTTPGAPQVIWSFLVGGTW